MNEFAEILNLFIANVIAYTFFVAVYGFIIYNVGKIIYLSFLDSKQTVSTWTPCGNISVVETRISS